MVDSFILESSVAHMAVSSITEALLISARYCMRSLGSHYAAVLAKRITNHTFIQVVLRHRATYLVI